MSVVVDSAVIAVISAGVSIAGLIFTYIKFITKQNERLAQLETKMDLIWGYIDENIGKILHSPHTPDIDTLIEKMPKVSLIEAQKLKCLLLEQHEVETDPKKLFAYGLYLARIDSLIIDKMKTK